MVADAFRYKGQKYAVELLVTDTCAYDVLRATERTIVVRRRMRDRTRPSVRSPHHDQGPWPVVLSPTASDPTAEERRLRLRKDGTFRLADWGNPLTFTDDEPQERTDYRF